MWQWTPTSEPVGRHARAGQSPSPSVDDNGFTAVSGPMRARANSPRPDHRLDIEWLNQADLVGRYGYAGNDRCPVTRPMSTGALLGSQVSYRAWSQVPGSLESTRVPGVDAAARVLPPATRRTSTEPAERLMDQPVSSSRTKRLRGTLAGIAAMLFAGTGVTACFNHVPSRVDALIDQVDADAGTVEHVMAAMTVGHDDRLMNLIAIVAS